MQRALVSILAPLLVVALAACGGEEAPQPAPKPAASKPTAPAPAPPAASRAPADLPSGLMLALSQFEVSPAGKVLPKPQAARLEFLTREGGEWKVDALEDADSNVFHKGMVFGDGLLTLGGSGAHLKLWTRGAGGWEAETLWAKDFGGKFSRMRDAEAADLFGDGKLALAVATHDQGVVATVRADGAGGWEVTEVDAEPDTFVHEIEIGDVDGDGVLEFYSTPSEPNRLDGSVQTGVVNRYVPARDEGPDVVADLGNRHAKEILVKDVDGDGTDELYVAVEALTEGTRGNLRMLEPVEIRRYDADTDPTAGAVVATLDDRLCRFLTAGDVDGDGRREMVAAGFKSGLWLLRPGDEPRAAWDVSSIDRSSSGFEHASLLADLDGDGRDELYVASDDQGEVRRYTWAGNGRFDKEVIYRRPVPRSVFTWNLMPVPLDKLH
ncbi:MAG: VCBS repeat-containing protein [Myxococcota bacterium]|nr:VCBS repeat-containing protein [Myxococcota bacterium]